MFHPRDLDVFCKVAQTGNMTRVAEAEAKTVMAISKQIGRLEEQLNQALFIRTQRKLTLTEFGKEFKQHAEAVLAQHRQLVDWSQSNRGSVSGQLNVICQANEVVTETLVPWMSEFLALYPELDVALDVKESLIDIRQDDYDVFWAIGAYLGDRFQGLKRRTLWRTKYGVFASPEYLERKGPPTAVDELAHHDVIGYLYNQPSNVLILQSMDGEPVYATPHCRVKTVAGLMELAEAGLGLINAPAEAEQIKTSIKKGTLKPVLEEYWWEDAQVFAYYHPSRPIQAKVRVFLDFFFDKRKQWQS